MRLGTATKVKPITQGEIDELKALRASYEAAKARFEEIKATVESLEAHLIVRVEQGAPQLCQDRVVVRTTERRYPAWKEAFLSRLGEQEVARVVESTPSTIYKRLVVRTSELERKKEAA